MYGVCVFYARLFTHDVISIQALHGLMVSWSILLTSLNEWLDPWAIRGASRKAVAKGRFTCCFLQDEYLCTH